MAGRFERIDILEIGAKGDGTGKLNGKPVYIPKTAPGDCVKAKIIRENKDEITADAVEIIAPGPARISAPCAYFERCGGCALQHVNENFYREWKIAKVKTALARAGIKFETPVESIFLGSSTRRRATMAARKTGGNIHLGFHEARSHNILDIKTCLVLEPELDNAIQSMRPFLPRILGEKKPADIMLQHAGNALDMVLTGFTDVSLEQHEALSELAQTLGIARISVRSRETESPSPLFTRQNIIKKFGALSIALPPGAFLQASAEGEKTLAAIVSRHTEGAALAADLFSGCGTFSGVLLAGGARVYAADSDAASIQALQAAKHPGLNAQRRNLFKDPLSSAELERFDIAVIDPPRAGAAAQCESIAGSALKKLVYISCNPASFARDARILLDGGFAMISLTVIDQFVWSAHIELAGVFARQGA